MDQLIHAFGLDVKLIIIQVFNFGILMLLLTYFLYKPVLKMLSDREEKIAKGIEDAEGAAKALAEAETEKQGILTNANKEAEAVVERAKSYADEKAAGIAAAADEKAAGIVSAAEQKAEEIKHKAHKESESEIAQLAVLAAEKVLREKA